MSDLSVTNAIPIDYKAIRKVIALASQSKAPAGYECTHIHLYTDSMGNFIYGKPRYKNLATGEKWIRSYSMDSNNHWQLKDPDFTALYPSGQGKKPLYRLHELAIGEIVYIFEGEQKADYAHDTLGLTATTAGGSNAVNSHDWQPLAGHKCVLWRDNDTAGEKWLNDVLTVLQPLGCDVAIIDVDKLDLPTKGDIIDYSQALYADGEDDIGILQAIKNLPTLDSKQVLEILSQQASDSLADDGGQVISYQTAQTMINDLAKLDELAYQMQKRVIAKQLDMGVNDLDKIVNKARQGLEVGKIASTIPEIEPYPDTVNGDELAHEILTIIKNHIACNDAIAITATLWVFFSWCVEIAYIAPIAWINAPEKGCGKSTLATLMGRMSKRTLATSNITPASLFRSIEYFKPTLIIDEADSFMNNNEDLRGIINAGFCRDNCHLLRCVGDNHEPTPFNVFGAKVISGIGKLPPTVMDRSISLTLKRKLASETKARLKELPKDTTNTIQSKLARWAEDNMTAISNSKPALPAHVYNRDFDKWEILYQIADTIGGNWLQLIANACLYITGNTPAEPSLGQELLGDIKAIFETQQCEAIPTRDLLTALITSSSDGDIRAWATYNKGQPLTERQLAKMLKGFEIYSRKINFPNDTQKRGYYQSDFKDAFLRYLTQP